MQPPHDPQPAQPQYGTQLRLLIALVVWGESYVREFLDYSLPSLLAEGNLPDIEHLSGSRFLVMTTAADHSRLTAHPLFRVLEQILPTEFVDISSFQAGDKYRLASRCHVEALRRSEDFDAVMLLYPDMIWSRGGITFAAERIARGALGFFSPAPTVLPGPTLNALLVEPGTVSDTPNGRIFSIHPRRLASIVLRHHHPMWASYDWDGDCFTDFTSCLRWNIPGQGWLIRCFHLHPVALRVQRDNPAFFTDFTTSLDGEYVTRLFSSTDRLDFARDTEHFALVTLRDASSPPLPRPGCRADVADVARWAEANALLLHRAFAKISFRWHDAQIDEATWQLAERRAELIVAQVRDRLHTPDSIIRVEDPTAYRARKRRRVAQRRLRSRVMLPPSYDKHSRVKLMGLLARNVAYDTAWWLAEVARCSPLTVYLRQNATMLQMWKRVKPAIVPHNRIDRAVSAGSLLRHIIRRRETQNWPDPRN